MLNLWVIKIYLIYIWQTLVSTSFSWENITADSVTDYLFWAI